MSVYNDGYCGANEEWLDPTHQSVVPAAISDLNSRSNSKWFFFETIFTFAPVADSQLEIRAYRPPEPYKGKGIRYEDEEVIKKEAKKKWSV